MTITLIQTAPGVRACCDEAGRVARFALVPHTREHLIGMLYAHGEGSRDELEQRITDMIAAGLLIELDRT